MQALVARRLFAAPFSEPRHLRRNCVEDVTGTLISGDSRAAAAPGERSAAGLARLAHKVAPD